MSQLATFFAPAPEPPTKLGRYQILSSTAGVRVSPLQLGGMSIGQGWTSFLGVIEKRQAFDLLDAYVARGGNFIDTANNYQHEESEKWLGEWMASRRGMRERIVLATKFTTDYRAHELGKGNAINFCGNHRRSLNISVRDSLRKLQTDYIDLLYVHWWDYTTSIKEVMDSLHFLVEKGTVLYLGISDTPAWIVAAANTYAIENGKTPFSVYQGKWSLAERSFERDIIPMARHFGMALAPWGVLGSGKFQTKKEVDQRKATGEALRGGSSSNSLQTEQEIRVSEALAKVAEEHGVESVTAIALAYVIAKAPKVFPIVGGRKIEHLDDNIKALSIKLTPEQIQYLESITPFDIGFPLSMIGDDPKFSGKKAVLLNTSGTIDF